MSLEHNASGATSSGAVTLEPGRSAGLERAQSPDAGAESKMLSGTVVSQ